MYPGERGKFTAAAKEAELIDVNAAGIYSIHNLFKHAPAYVKKRMIRLGTAPKAPRADTKTPNSVPNGMENAENEAARDTYPRTENREPKPRSENREPPEQEPPASASSTADPQIRPPNPEEVKEFAKLFGHGEEAFADEFWDNYASNGWLNKHKVPVRDWKAEFRKWVRARARVGPPVASNSRSPPHTNGRPTAADLARKAAAAIQERKS
jgi:hypothetical protein